LLKKRLLRGSSWAFGDKPRATTCHCRDISPGQDGQAGVYAAHIQHHRWRPLRSVPHRVHAPGRTNTEARLRRLLKARYGDTDAPERREGRGRLLRVVWTGAPDDGPPQVDAAAQSPDQPAFHRRSPAGGARLRTYGGRRGDRNHGTAERDHEADRQETDRDVNLRELIPLVVPEGPLEPVSGSRQGGTSSVFQRLASRRSTEDVGQEVRRGETLG
jgi:hypothetical protein